MSHFHILILSLIEGLTEFIPVSSTGHLIIANQILRIPSTEFSKAFDIIIQFGAIAAVVMVYRERFKFQLGFYKKLLIGFLPAAVIGFAGKDYFSALMESAGVVAWALIAGGIVMIATDYLFKHPKNAEISNLDTFKIGLFQCLALVPGVSRSAATIIGGQTVGLDKKTAAEFSFFLAVPTLTAASIYKLYKIRDVLQADQIATLTLGIILSFVFAILAIKFFIRIVQRYGFKWFGIYRIVLGVIVLINLD